VSPNYALGSAMRQNVLFGLAGLLALVSCYGHTRFVTVEPVRYVPAPAEPIPNSTFGWIETTADQAERFRVRVGDLNYQEIIEPHKINGEVSKEAAVTALATFAEQEVVKRGFCTRASTPEDARRLVGSNSPPAMWIFVQCAK